MTKSQEFSPKLYRDIYRRVPRFCVDVVIRSSRGVLLSRRSIRPYVGWWHFPGGRVRLKERLARAIKRICREELGLSVKVLKLAGVIEYLREPTVRGLTIHSVSAVFIVKPSGGALRGSWQAEAVAFFKSPPRRTIPAVKKFLLAHGFVKG